MNSGLFFLKQDRLGVFLPVLQEGFQVVAKVGCDIKSLLCDQFELTPDYLSERVGTVFLNGKPVDDVASAVVEDGDTLALSAAMPGLVGATFRKAGYLAAFRGSITYRQGEAGSKVDYDGSITLKLFNLLIRELGPQFLRHGIWIRGDILRDHWQAHPSDFQTAIAKIVKDGREVSSEKGDPLTWIAPDTRIFLQAI